MATSNIATTSCTLTWTASAGTGSKTYYIYRNGASGRLSGEEEQLENDDVNVSPNPATAVLHVSGVTTFECLITDVCGSAYVKRQQRH